MSKKKTKEEPNQTEEIKEPSETLKEAVSTITLEDLKIAYVVGLTEEDQFIFEMFGQDRGLVQLLGIHQHASRRVEKIYDDQQMSGDRLMHEVGKAIAEVSKKLDGFKINEAPQAIPTQVEEVSTQLTK